MLMESRRPADQDVPYARHESLNSNVDESKITDVVQDLKKNLVLNSTPVPRRAPRKACPELPVDFCQVHASRVILANELFGNETERRIQDVIVHWP